MKKVFIYGTQKKLSNYINALNNAGVCAIVSKNLNDAISCNALLLSGGGDVYPYLYGKNISANNIDFKRDLAEISLINHFYIKNLPILGVCRGMQILNVAFGGTLNNVQTSSILHSNDFTDTIHKITNVNGFLRRLYGNTATVNSAHNQRLSMLANSFEICSISSDGVIEGIQHKNKPIFGVQFHPERMNNGYHIYHYFASFMQD